MLQQSLHATHDGTTAAFARSYSTWLGFKRSHDNRLSTTHRKKQKSLGESTWSLKPRSHYMTFDLTFQEALQLVDKPPQIIVWLAVTHPEGSPAYSRLDDDTDQSGTWGDWNPRVLSEVGTWKKNGTANVRIFKSCSVNWKLWSLRPELL